jgi:Tol biopolymer transport system component
MRRGSVAVLIFVLLWFAGRWMIPRLGLVWLITHLDYRRQTDLYVDPRPVEIAGYSGSAMEPFISPDGMFLLFNNASGEEGDVNDSPKRMYFASRTGALSFRFLGELPGVNAHIAGSRTDAAVPSLDARGRLYFTSDRQYRKDRNSIFVGDFNGRAVTNVHAVEGDISDPGTPGQINLDMGISPDGETLFVSRASVGPFGLLSRLLGRPLEFHLLEARREGDRFNLDPKSAQTLKNVDSGFEYAPAVSRDGLELFFSRGPRIMVASRSSVDHPFDEPRVLSALTGEHAEAPTISLDSKELFFHQAVSGKCCAIFRAARNPDLQR